jgi:antitoxin component of MazEF toxin-antitoxin module
LVLDKPMLDELGLDENAEIEVSTDGQVIVIAPRRTAGRERKFMDAAGPINRKYAGLFKRLGE